MSAWLQNSGATQVQLERDVGRTITPTLPEEQENEAEKRVSGKAQPTNILPGSKTFPSPGKSCIAQARCGCPARWHQAGGGYEEQEGETGDGGGGEEHHACGLRPPSTGTLRGHCKLNSMA